MNLNEATDVNRKRDRKRRVGRGNGSGNGKTCGRGMRGARCRAGYGGMLSYEGGQMPWFRRLPRRGFNNKRFRLPIGHVNLSDLNRLEGVAEITPEVLRERGLISRTTEIVKVLGDGNVEKPLAVKAHRFSKSAVEKIEAAGGSVEVLA